MDALNISLFLALNAPAEPSGFMLAMALFGARWLVYVAALAMVAMILVGPRSARGGFIATCVGAIAGLTVNFIIRHLWYHPRPFALGLGHQFLFHAPNASFPSDHATFMWALACGLLVSGASRVIGFLFFLFGLWVAWARIYVGIHFPLDMVGALLVAIAAGFFAASIRSAADSWVTYALKFRRR